jgi:DNA-binding GntR family transcriptional regulator
MDRQVDSLETGAKRGTLASTVFDRLRQDVLNGVLRPNEKLRIESLRQRYDVGASPVREALNRLVSEGLVLLEDQKGFRVAPVSREELHEIARTRCLINEIALRESIAHGDADWEEGIVVAYHRWQRSMRPNTSADDTERARRHREFHTALISACGSHWIVSLAELLFDTCQRYRELANQASLASRDIDAEILTGMDAEHRAIMDAVLARDTERAIKLHNEHVRTLFVANADSAVRADNAA